VYVVQCSIEFLQETVIYLGQSIDQTKEAFENIYPQIFEPAHLQIPRKLESDMASSAQFYWSSTI